MMRLLTNAERRARVSRLLVALLALATACRAPAPLAGSDLGMTPAPAFALEDQRGARVALDSLRGQPVVLTFLYTECPDVCPLTASKLRKVADALGPAADQVAFVAVSTDPAHDDAAAARAFAEKHGLGDRLRFLLGSSAELAPVWSAYYVHAAPAPTAADPAERAGAAYAARGTVHTDAVFLIDRQGRERSFLRSDFEPTALTASLRTLLAE